MKIKTVITSIKTVWVKPGPLGATWELSGPLYGQLVELGKNIAVLRLRFYFAIKP